MAAILSFWPLRSLIAPPDGPSRFSRIFLYTDLCSPGLFQSTRIKSNSNSNCSYNGVVLMKCGRCLSSVKSTRLDSPARMAQQTSASTPCPTDVLSSLCPLLAMYVPPLICSWRRTCSLFFLWPIDRPIRYDSIPFDCTRFNSTQIPGLEVVSSAYEDDVPAVSADDITC